MFSDFCIFNQSELGNQF